MRELVSESRECDVCGSRVRAARGALNVKARGAAFVESFGRDGRVTRVRSGLAYVAGYAGVLYLFGYPFAPVALSRWWLGPGALLLSAWSLFAPLALALAFAAAVSLDRSREKSGALPAMFGLVVGLVGTADLLYVLAPLLKYLRAF